MPVGRRCGAVTRVRTHGQAPLTRMRAEGPSQPEYVRRWTCPMRRRVLRRSRARCPAKQSLLEARGLGARITGGFSWLWQRRSVGLRDIPSRDSVSRSRQHGLGSQRVTPWIARVHARGGVLLTGLPRLIKEVDPSASAPRAVVRGVCRTGRVSRIAGEHYLFVTNGRDVLREIDSVVSSISEKP